MTSDSLRTYRFLAAGAVLCGACLVTNLIVMSSTIGPTWISAVGVLVAMAGLDRYRRLISLIDRGRR